MTNGNVALTEGSGKYAATYSVSEDAVTKQVQRVTLNNSAGTEITSLPVTGTFYQATQPVSGTFYQATQPVSGTVTANLGATDNAVLDAIEVDTTSIDAKIPALGQALAAASVPVILPSATITTLTPPAAITGFSTSAKQDTLLTELQLKADLTETQPVSLATVPSHAVTNSGTFATQVDAILPTQSDLATLATTHVKKYYTNAGAVTDGIIWSPAAGKRWYITDIYIQVSAAATVTLEDDLAGGDSPIWKAEIAANSGWSHSFNTPWFSGEDAADLIITTSAGNVYVTCVGYEI